MDIARELAEIESHALEESRGSFLHQLDSESVQSTGIYGFLTTSNQQCRQSSLPSVATNKPPAPIALTQTISSRTAEDAVDDSSIWCPECNDNVLDGCKVHPVVPVLDREIPTRARLSLPSNFVVTLTSNGKETVMCKKIVRSRSQFGPMIGRRLECASAENMVFLTNTDYYLLDISDEQLSNWMMFVKRAEKPSQQNLVAYQYKGSIYFSSTCKILPGQELRYEYSEAYSKLLGEKLIKPSEFLSPREKSVVIKDGFPCDSCDSVFNEFDELDGHVCPHESGTKGRRTRNKRKGRPQKLGLSTPKIATKSGQQIEKSNTRQKNSVSHQNVKCGSCDLVFNTQRRLGIHMYVHTGQYPYKCDNSDCAKSFNSKFKLDRHRLTHGSREFTCSHCGKGFARKDNLQAHLIIHDNNRQMFRCTYSRCEKEYNSKVSFKVHVAIHQAQEGVKDCSICKQCFDNKDALIRHIKVHAGSQQIKGIMEKKHKCSHCEKRFFASKDKQRHILTHTKEKHFECHLCPMRFGRSDHLKRHLSKIHPNGERDSKSSAARVNKRSCDPMAEITASDLTKSIQQLFTDPISLEGQGHAMPVSNDCSISGSTVQITPYVVTSNTQRMVISQPSHEINFSTSQTLQSNQANSIATTGNQRVGINALLNNLSSSSVSQPFEAQITSYVKPVTTNNWQTMVCNDNVQKYSVFNTDSTNSMKGTVTNCHPTMILIPEGQGNQLTAAIDQRQANNLIDSTSHLLQTENICSEYTSDSLKVLNTLTPIFLNQDSTTPDGDYMPVVYQQYNQASQQ